MWPATSERERESARTKQPSHCSVGVSRLFSRLFLEIDSFTWSRTAAQADVVNCVMDDLHRERCKAQGQMQSARAHAARLVTETKKISFQTKAATLQKEGKRLTSWIFSAWTSSMMLAIMLSIASFTPRSTSACFRASTIVPIDVSVSAKLLSTQAWRSVICGTDEHPNRGAEKPS